MFHVKPEQGEGTGPNLYYNAEFAGLKPLAT